MASLRFLAFGVIVALASSGCGVESSDAAPEPISNNLASAMTFDEFLETVHQDSTGKYTYDGDTPARDMNDLRRAFAAEYPLSGALTVDSVNGADDVWHGGAQLNLTYCVSNSFGANKSAVVSALSAAGNAWSASVLVNFVYVPAQDGSCTSANNNVVFNVAPVSGTTYYAASFFPSWARASRTLNIDSAAYSSGYPLSGILMHELGHALGFRHEFVRQSSSCQSEGGSWRPVTSYDAGSIMDYPYAACGGTNPFTGLAQTDIEGAAQLYGSRNDWEPGGPTGCGLMNAGQVLLRNQALYSCDGTHALAQQTDGNLVLYHLPSWTAIWSSGTWGQPGYRTELGSDGNFVISSSLWRPLWSTGTWGHAGAMLVVQNDGNLVIYSAQWQPLWSSGTWNK